jgi:asparagine synthase (glutamine-hydrolysing)
MCGIAGGIGALTDGELAAMLARLHHRGPDGRGALRRGDVAVGATRLSLRDLAGGHQPLALPAAALVHNGEAYNDAALRAALPGPFASRCDTEVVARAWQTWGAQAWTRVDGMFAAAVAGDDGLILARDRFGQKPLFFWHDDRTLLFASELQALLASPRVPRRVDERALVELAVLGFPLADGALLAGVASVPPGHALHVRRGADGRLDLELRPHPTPAPREGDEDALVDELARVLPDVVAAHLVADHPVGLYLSGGLDSGLLAALARAAGPLHTFSVADDPAHPDLAAADELAARLGATHHRWIVGPAELEAAWPAAVRAQGLPTPPTIPDLSAARVRAHVKAVLVGDGADELFAGYALHLDPDAYVSRLVATYNALVQARAVRRGAADRLQAALAALVRPPDDRTAAVHRLLRDQRLAPNHLRRWDHSTMAASLEARLPFLAQPVAAVADAATPAVHVAGGVPKQLLRRAARRLLPDAVAAPLLARAKSTAPSALARARAALEARCRDLVPAEHRARHPWRALAGGSAATLVAMDLFALQYLAHPGVAPDGLTLGTLYREHAGALADALHAPAEVPGAPAGA